MGLIAAIPGLIDYLFTVPPKSSAKKRGLKHALLNVSHLILFFIAFLIRINENPDTTLILILEAAGVILIFIAGWLGGTLVYRNQIGVDPRYAEAGKWKEEYFNDTKEKIKVATKDELKLNQMKLLHVGSKRIVLGKTEEGYVAFDDHCTHKGGSLAGGAMICATVQCPWHGSQFDVTNGQVKAGPAKENIHTYLLTESDGNVYLHL
jgi:nitrite reductase/ring-hydroxylating ferredoxin subunit